MEQMQLFFTNKVKLDEVRVMKLDYSLIERKSELNQPYFGVRVTKMLEDSIESDEIPGISASREGAIAILEKLFQYEVTPISMVEIVDELVTQGI
jgi:hypothetical protein